jgi:hypothetical protein
MDTQIYILTVKHDNGKIKIRTTATSPLIAKNMVMAAENCPACAIQKIEEYTPASIDLITPDGFSISFDETWKTKTAAKEAYKKWVKRYETQGYYSSSQYGRIPLTDLWGYMTFERRGVIREDVTAEAIN